MIQQLNPHTRAFIGYTNYEDPHQTFEQMYNAGYSFPRMCQKLGMAETSLTRLINQAHKEGKIKKRSTTRNWPMKTKVKAVAMMDRMSARDVVKKINAESGGKKLTTGLLYGWRKQLNDLCA